MDVKSKDFNFEIDDLNNDGITSNEFHQNFLWEGRIYSERLRLKMIIMKFNDVLRCRNDY